MNLLKPYVAREVTKSGLLGDPPAGQPDAPPAGQPEAPPAGQPDAPPAPLPLLSMMEGEKELSMHSTVDNDAQLILQCFKCVP